MRGGENVAVKQNIIDRRKELRITQKAVADGAKISRSSYAAIERGLRAPSLETAIRICTVLKMPVDKAFPIEENKK
jgi:DNA-binding XRE family transcriptional regulator